MKAAVAKEVRAVLLRLKRKAAKRRLSIGDDYARRFALAAEQDIAAELAKIKVQS